MAGLPQQIASGFRLDLGPLKEPLGFIRILEWVFSIFSFATTGGYTGSSTFTVICDQEKHVPVNVPFGYPFRFANYEFIFPNCTFPDNPLKITRSDDLSSSAEFYVCIGVFGFLYCTATLVLYLGYQHVYRETTRGPMIDLFLTAIFAILWLVSSSAWGKGLTDLKWVTNPNTIIKSIDPCALAKCEVGKFPSMGRLNASVICGFLNLILWGSNCWFIYKETPFHKPNHATATATDETGP